MSVAHIAELPRRTGKIQGKLFIINCLQRLHGNPTIPLSSLYIHLQFVFIACTPDPASAAPSESP
jgi:hypothetical protein